MIADKIELHRNFWSGMGSSLILIPPCEGELYDLDDYCRRFNHPAEMWKSEMNRARPVVGWPTDGIPCVRANLGVVFVPALAGQGFKVIEGSMPWPDAPLTAEAIRAARKGELRDAETMRLAYEFYRIHQESGEKEVAAYLPDTQGVFDIAHLLRGDEIFYDLATPETSDWIQELMDLSFELYKEATSLVKDAIGESNGQMVHGHGTPQGIFFPNAGVRVSEDTATLLSPATIKEVVVPGVERCIETFGGVFLHFCGHHENLFQQLLALPGVKAVDLGNPEAYPLDDLMRWCAQSETILYSRLPAKPDEDWQAYARRIAKTANRHGTRVILRPMVFPKSREECADMLGLWHAETDTGAAGKGS
ncbi:MAG: hypothetical protein JW808_05350 [Victivallales bacterium]|nr:hypothetical protein [Victivallales bacterium]